MGYPELKFAQFTKFVVVLCIFPVYYTFFTPNGLLLNVIYQNGTKLSSIEQKMRVAQKCGWH